MSSKISPPSVIRPGSALITRTMTFGALTIFTVSRACGSFPFRITPESATIPKLHLCYCLIFQAILTSQLALGILSQEFMEKELHPILRRSVCYRAVVNFVTVLLSFIFLFFKRLEILTFVRQLESIDAKLAGVGLRISYKVKYKWIDIFVIILIYFLGVEMTKGWSSGYGVIAWLGTFIYFLCAINEYGTVHCISEPVDEILKRLQTIIR